MLESMRRLLVSSERFRSRAAEHLGLALSEVIMLSLIGYPEPLTPTDLAVALGRNASTITAAIDRLESAGLIVRKPHPNDRRKTILAVSGEGQRALRWLRSFSVDAFAHLDAAALEDLAESFTGTAESIEAQARRLDTQPFVPSGRRPRD
jgi:DNA-binding MarR family transcriptional regulator